MIGMSTKRKWPIIRRNNDENFQKLMKDFKSSVKPKQGKYKTKHI